MSTFRPIKRALAFALGLLPGCGLFFVFPPDVSPVSLSASLRPNRYQLFRAPSWANQTSLRVLPIGGTPPHSFEWAVIGPDGHLASECLDTLTHNIVRFTANGTDGSHTVRCIVRDAEERHYVATTVIEVGGDLGLDIATECMGVRAGGGPHGQTSLRVNPKFGVPPYEVTWICTGPDGMMDNDRLDVTDPMVPRFTSSDLVGRYILTATIIDAQGRTDTQSFIVAVGQEPGLDIACDRGTILPGGGRDGMARLLATAVGGTPPYTYDWEIVGPDGTDRTELLWDAQHRSPVFESDDQTGTFLARCAVTDSTGIVLIGSANLVVGQQITVDISADRLVLPAGADSGHTAELFADVRGGHGGTTLAWTVTAPRPVTGPDGEDVSALLSSTSQAAVSLTPGETPGPYVVRCEATDGEGQSATDTLTLFVGGTLGVVVSASNPWPATGGVAPTGTSRLSTRVYGGTPPYSYEWAVADPGGQPAPERLDDATSSEPTFTSSLLAGQHFVTCTVTDSAGQVAADGILLNVGQPLNVDVTADKQSLTGGGGASGQTQLITTLHGGVAPYSFEWTVHDENNEPDPSRLSDSQIANPVFTSTLNTGTYRLVLTTTDAMGVVFVDSVEIVVGSTGGGAGVQNFSADVSAGRLTLSSGGDTARASVLTTGGVPPLSFTWTVTDPDGNQADDRLDSTTSDAVVFTSNDTQGTWRLRCTASDAVGNTFTDSVQIIVTDDFHVDLSGSENYITPVGTVDLRATRTGGSSPFTYSWTCVDATGNAAGQFSNGATGAGTAVTAAADHGGNTWQAPAGIGALGGYRLTVTATDSLGRSFTDSMTVTVNHGMTVGLSADRVHIRPGQSITLNADRTGGSPNFTYSWTGTNAAGSLAGTFTTASTGTGSAVQTAADDATNIWTAPGANPGTLGTYRIKVSVEDADGITFASTIMVVVDEPFSLDVRASDAFIPPGGSTTLTADQTGGERNFSYAWTAINSAGAAAGTFSNGSTGTGTAAQTNQSNDATNIWTAPAGLDDTYLITCVATDHLDRQFTDSTQIAVGAADAPLLSLSSNHVHLGPGETIDLWATQHNGVPDLSYTWTAVDEFGAPAGTLALDSQMGLAGDSSNTWTAPALATGVLGTYRIQAVVMDVLGRQAVDTVQVVVESPLSLDLRANQSVVAPSAPVLLTAVPAGGEPPYHYTWQAIDSSSAAADTFTVGSVATGLALQTDEPGNADNIWSAADEETYTITCTVTDSAGQTFTASVSLVVTTQQVLLLDLTIDQLSVAPGETIELAANRIGGTANYNYTWSAVDESGAAAGTLGAASQNGLPGDAANTWTAPADDGTYRITCTLMDFAGRSAMDTAFVRVSSLAIQNIFLAPPTSTLLLPESHLTNAARGADPGRQLFPVDGLESPAHPRNVVITIIDQNNSIQGGFVRVTGLDARGFEQSEVITIPGTSGGVSISTGQCPFATLQQVDAFGFSGTSNNIWNPDTISISTGNKFGLSGLLRVPSDVPYIYEGSEVFTGGFTLDLTPGQQGIQFNSPPNGSRDYIVVFRAR